MSVETPQSDAYLLHAVRGGDATAYGQLYERHVAAARALAGQLVYGEAEVEDVVAESFTRVLDHVGRGGGPASAFRTYLLIVVRRTVHDRTRVTGEIELSDTAMPADPASARLEGSLIAQAYLSLAERWRAVLWHTEVENARSADVAPLLGLSANGVSALAYRAREGLRQAYLQLYLTGSPPPECKAVIGKLGAYVRGGLTRRDSRSVDEHVRDCPNCHTVLRELTDVNRGLRTVIGPLVLGDAAAGYLEALSRPAPAPRRTLGRMRRTHVAVAGGAATVMAVAAAFAVVSGQDVGARPDAHPRSAADQYDHVGPYGENLSHTGAGGTGGSGSDGSTGGGSGSDGSGGDRSGADGPDSDGDGSDPGGSDADGPGAQAQSSSGTGSQGSESAGPSDAAPQDTGTQGSGPPAASSPSDSKAVGLNGEAGTADRPSAMGPHGPSRAGVPSGRPPALVPPHDPDGNHTGSPPDHASGDRTGASPGEASRDRTGPPDREHAGSSSSEAGADRDGSSPGRPARKRAGSSSGNPDRDRGRSSSGEPRRDRGGSSPGGPDRERGGSSSGEPRGDRAGSSSRMPDRDRGGSSSRDPRRDRAGSSSRMPDRERAGSSSGEARRDRDGSSSGEPRRDRARSSSDEAGGERASRPERERVGASSERRTARLRASVAAMGSLVRGEDGIVAMRVRNIGNAPTRDIYAAIELPPGVTLVPQTSPIAETPWTVPGKPGAVQWVAAERHAASRLSQSSTDTDTEGWDTSEVSPRDDGTLTPGNAIPMHTRGVAADLGAVGWGVLLPAALHELPPETAGSPAGGSVRAQEGTAEAGGGVDVSAGRGGTVLPLAVMRGRSASSLADGYASQVQESSAVNREVTNLAGGVLLPAAMRWHEGEAASGLVRAQEGAADRAGTDVGGGVLPPAAPREPSQERAGSLGRLWGSATGAGDQAAVQWGDKAEIGDRAAVQWVVDEAEAEDRAVVQWGDKAETQGRAAVQWKVDKAKTEDRAAVQWVVDEAETQDRAAVQWGDKAESQDRMAVQWVGDVREGRAGGWACRAVRGGVRCARAPLAAGKAASVFLRVRVARDAPEGEGPRLRVEAGALRLSARAPVGVREGGAPARFAADGRVTVRAVGNGLLTCPDKGQGCAERPRGEHRDGDLEPLDLDRFRKTKASSAARLDLPQGGRILWAGLYWSATAEGAGPIKLKPPGRGRYVTVRPSRVAWQKLPHGPAYQAYADVTGLAASAAKNGEWWAADPPMGTRGHAGWSLVVVTTDPAAPYGNAVVLDDARIVGGDSPALRLPLGGLEPAGAPARVELVAWAGDAGLRGDRASPSNGRVTPERGNRDAGSGSAGTPEGGDRDAGHGPVTPEGGNRDAGNGRVTPERGNRDAGSGSAGTPEGGDRDAGHGPVTPEGGSRGAGGGRVMPEVRDRDAGDASVGTTFGVDVDTVSHVLGHRPSLTITGKEGVVLFGVVAVSVRARP
ncbi:zf-HC2 domain-containing protein [Nonomuraea sp. C10]|uniref:zf-HC2 domain-containing protein n=1 Tax=Nonomuraea sp. C10 TaxID=2600577 RepID=UPI00164F5C0D|nr:zf-HC2 domain-containing protein [Nonomuraea sp. C10]